jgi:hypothetical protein
MRKIYFFVLVFAALGVLSAFGQVKFIKKYGVSSCGARQTSDGGYIMAGVNGGFIKTNSYGDTIWTKSYSLTPGMAIINFTLSSDGGYLACGGSGSQEGACIIKVDSIGSVLWLKRYYVSWVDWAYFYSIIQAFNGDYLFTGTTSADLGPTYAIGGKTDINGNGLPSSVIISDSSIQGNAIIQTADSGFVFCGSAGVWYNSKIYIARTNSSNAVLWCKKYWVTGASFGINSIVQVNDGGFIACGSEGSKFMLLKLKSNGALSWIRTYGNGSANSLKQNADGTLILTGYINSYYDTPLLKTDADGNLIWSKTFMHIGTGRSVDITSDGGYCIATDASYLIKTDSMGNSGCYENDIPVTVDSLLINVANTSGYTAWTPDTAGITYTSSSAGYDSTICFSNCSVLLATTQTPPVLCYQNTASVAVIATGGVEPYTYSWSTGDTASSINNIPVGAYSVTVTDSIGCSAMEVVNITQPAVLTATAQLLNNVLCHGQSNGKAKSNVSGGVYPYTYSWTPAGGTGITATNLSPGCYTVSVTDHNGCTSVSSVCITEPDSLITASSTLQNVTCYGGCDGVHAATPSGGTAPYTYQWNPSGCATATCSARCAGCYTFTVRDSKGCTTTSTTCITQPPAPFFNISTNNLNCYGDSSGTITVSYSSNGGPPYTYNWSPTGDTTVSINNVPAGNYTVTVYDSVGCSATQAVTITQPLLLTAAVTAGHGITCYNLSDGTAVVTATGGTTPYTYQWSPAAGSTSTASNLAAGNHTCSVTDAHGCSAGVYVVITEPPPLYATTQALQNVSCNGGNDGAATEMVVSGVPPFTYQWSPGGCNTATCTNLSAGLYYIILTDSNGCILIDTIGIAEPTALSSPICETDPPLCNGGSDGCAAVCASGGTPAYSYAWNPTGNSGYSVCGLSPGCYTVTVTDANGCTEQSVACISDPDSITVSLTGTDASCSSCNDGSIEATAIGGTGSYTYSWTPSSQTGQTATGLTPGVYTCCVTDLNGCSTCTSDTVSYPTSVNEISNSDFIISPNPFTTKLTITTSSKPQTSNLKPETTITLFDYTGKEILHTTSSSEETVLDTEGIAAGFYLLRVESGGGVANYKVVKSE